MKSRFCGPVSRQPAFPWQPFCVPRIWGGIVLMSASKYQLDILSYCTFNLNMLRDLVTMTFDRLTLESCHVIPLVWPIPAPSLNWMTYRFRVRTITIFHSPPAKSPNCYLVWRDKRGQISNFIFLTPKRHCLGQNDVLCVRVCPKM